MPIHFSKVTGYHSRMSCQTVSIYPAFLVYSFDCPLRLQSSRIDDKTELDISSTGLGPSLGTI